MTVYVDGVFALNSILNYLLLLGAARLGGGAIRQKRLIPAALLGGIYAAAALYPALGFLQSFGIKLLIPAGMLLLAFGFEKRTLRLGTLFLALSLGFAGAAFACTRLFGKGLLLLGGSAYYPVSFPGLVLLAAGLYLAARLGFSGAAQHGSGEIAPMTLRLGSRKTELRALHDTGNTLRDPITNECVLVANWQTAAKLLPEAALRQSDFRQPAVLLTRLAAEYPKLRFRLIPYRAVGTESGMLLALCCEQVGKGRVLTAFSPTPVSDGGNFDALTGG